MRTRLFLRTSLLAAAALFILPASGAVAQGAGRGGPGAAARQQELIDKVIKDLGLDAKQAEKVGTVLKAEAEKRNTLFQEMRAGGGDPQSMRARMGELTEGTEKKLAAVLTKEQVAKYKGIRAAWQAGGRGQGRRPNPSR